MREIISTIIIGIRAVVAIIFLIIEMESVKSRAAITNLIESVSTSVGIDHYEIHNVQTNAKGEGFLGDIFFVDVRDRDDTTKELHLAIKAAFVDETLRQMAPVRLLFQNEIKFYTQVLPLFQRFAQNRGIVNTIDLCPKLYASSLDEGNEMLVLENLKHCGFEVFNKESVVDQQHVELIFRSYGQFHAYSYALRDQQPETYAEIADSLPNVYEIITVDKFLGICIIELGKLVKNYLIPGEDDVILEKYRKYSPENMVKTFLESLDGSGKYAIILHGDCWSNNMMFKYEDDDGVRRLKDIRLLDWQLIKKGSPVCDLAYCLYSGASRDIYDKLDDYLRIYHRSFSEFARKLGSDPDKLFPFAALKEEWKKFAKFGLIMAMNIRRNKTMLKEDTCDLGDGVTDEEVVSNFMRTRFDEPLYKRQIRDIIEHMNEIDAL